MTTAVLRSTAIRTSTWIILASSPRATCRTMRAATGTSGRSRLALEVSAPSSCFLADPTGPVGSGKTALTLALCKRFRDRFNLAVLTNDIFTRCVRCHLSTSDGPREDQEYLIRNEVRFDELHQLCSRSDHRPAAARSSRSEPTCPGPLGPATHPLGGNGRMPSRGNPVRTLGFRPR